MQTDDERTSVTVPPEQQGCSKHNLNPPNAHLYGQADLLYLTCHLKPAKRKSSFCFGMKTSRAIYMLYESGCDLWAACIPVLRRRGLTPKNKTKYLSERIRVLKREPVAEFEIAQNLPLRGQERIIIVSFLSSKLIELQWFYSLHRRKVVGRSPSKCVDSKCQTREDRMIHPEYGLWICFWTDLRVWDYLSTKRIPCWFSLKMAS